MAAPIRVAILDDHQSIVDGYCYRLAEVPEVEVVATAAYGEDLEPLLAQQQVDVLLLDVEVPTAADNPNPYPMLHLISHLLTIYPALHVLVISMHDQATLIKAVMDAGASGYVLKDDRQTIQNLGAVVQLVAQGGIHLSQQAYQKLRRKLPEDPPLTLRQREALSLAAAYPDESAAALASRLNVAHSTVRNLLSGAYLQLGVHNRQAAVAKARQLGLITPTSQFHRE